MPNPKVLVNTRPEWDVATEYGSFWIGKTLIPIQDNGIIVDDLKGSEANLVELTNSLLENDPMLFWGFGHGQEDVFTGDNGQGLLIKGVNESLMSGRIVHLTSCLTGVEGGLCESLYDNGAVAVIGYGVDFIIGINSEDIPLAPDNPATTSLMKPDTVIETSLSEGKAVVDAFMDSDDVSELEIEYWRKSKHPDSDLIIWSHLNNQNGKKLYGLGASQVKAQAPPLKLITVGLIGATIFAGSMFVVTRKGGKK